MSTVTVRVVRAVRGPSAAELARRRAVLNYLWERYLLGRREAILNLNLPWKTKEVRS
jgi:hypothetical protein